MVNIKRPPREVRKNSVVTLGCHAMNRALRDKILPYFLLFTARRHAAPPQPLSLLLCKLHRHLHPQIPWVTEAIQ